MCGSWPDGPEFPSPGGFPIGVVLSLPGIFRIRVFFRRLQSKMIPTTISSINTRAFSAMIPRTAGRYLVRFSIVVATSVDNVTVVDPVSEFETL